MKKDYWEQFMKTGRIEDYLTYSRDGRCEVVMKIRSEQAGEDSESDYRDRDGAFSASGWRI